MNLLGKRHNKLSPAEGKHGEPAAEARAVVFSDTRKKWQTQIELASKEREQFDKGIATGETISLLGKLAAFTLIPLGASIASKARTAATCTCQSVITNPLIWALGTGIAIAGMALVYYLLD